MKLWDKGSKSQENIVNFTIGNDQKLDCMLAAYDILGNIAHANMLSSIGVLTQQEFFDIKRILLKIYSDVKNEKFTIENEVEDIHSQIELILTKELGETGKKIHCGRSRNDQILLDLKLFTRDKIHEVTEKTTILFDRLIHLSEKYKNVLMPGYTHMQIAMPSSFGLWFGAYAESLTDDLLILQTAYKICNQNPLGSAAGYGSSFPIDRELTTKLLGFESMNINSINAQMGRSKVEKTTLFAIASIGNTLAKLAMDIIQYLCQNFNFLSLPENLTTGSSIMPHKKNPDVFELIRAKCNKLNALPLEVSLISTNLSSGYHRDFQVLKEIFLPAFDELISCIGMMDFMISKVEINKNILDDKKYNYLFSVEETNKLVQKGISFRDAYKTIGEKIKSETFNPELHIRHTHKGSIGNLCNNEIIEKKDAILYGFNFEKVQNAIEKLLK